MTDVIYNWKDNRKSQQVIGGYSQLVLSINEPNFSSKANQHVGWVSNSRRVVEIEKVDNNSLFQPLRWWHVFCKGFLICATYLFLLVFAGQLLVRWTILICRTDYTLIGKIKTFLRFLFNNNLMLWHKPSLISKQTIINLLIHFFPFT